MCKKWYRYPKKYHINWYIKLIWYEIITVSSHLIPRYLETWYINWYSIGIWVDTWYINYINGLGGPAVSAVYQTENSKRRRVCEGYIVSCNIVSASPEHYEWCSWKTAKAARGGRWWLQCFSSRDPGPPYKEHDFAVTKKTYSSLRTYFDAVVDAQKLGKLVIGPWQFLASVWRRTQNSCYWCDNILWKHTKWAWSWDKSIVRPIPSCRDN
jgi:hypothetical protein